MKEDYKAIECSLYDQIEVAAMKKRICKIVYLNEKSERTVVEEAVIDLKTENKAEFMILESGLEIRLDKIIAINYEAFS